MANSQQTRTDAVECQHIDYSQCSAIVGQNPEAVNLMQSAN